MYICQYFLHIDDYKNKEDRRGNVDCIFGSVEGQITAARTETSASQSAPEARDSIQRIQQSPDLQRAEEGEAIQASIAFESSSNGTKVTFYIQVYYLSLLDFLATYNLEISEYNSTL